MASTQGDRWGPLSGLCPNRQLRGVTGPDRGGGGGGTTGEPGRGGGENSSTDFVRVSENKLAVDFYSLCFNGLE